MKFSFATALLTLTAASAIVFAAPTQDDSTARYFLYASFVSHRRAYQKYSGRDVINFDGDNIKGLVDGKPFVGKLGQAFPQHVQVHPMKYHFEKLSDLNGSFRGRIDGSNVLIQYDGSDATITGHALPPLSIHFEGVMKVLLN